MLKIVPKALFDTLEHMEDITPPCVHQYIQALNIAEAQAEYTLSKQFLANYDGSKDTFTAYRREIERLLQWAWLICRKPIKALDRNDLRHYIDFANNPPKTWVATKTVARFLNSDTIAQHNPAWRPFVVRISKARSHTGEIANIDNYQLSGKSMQALFATLSTYFTYLQQENYVDSNPVTLIRQKSRYLQRQQTRKVTRRLSHVQWLFVIQTAEKMAETNPEFERTLFLLSTFYLLGLRISELAETPGRIPHMGDFAPDKTDRWWFTTVGKGNKLRDVAVPDAMLAVLKRYRLHLGLPPLPARSETTPLLNKVRGKGGLGTRHIRNLVQQCFDYAIEALLKADKTDAAEDLRTATVHWLRHTAISTDVEDRPREHVRDDAGHGTVLTTDQYIDVDRQARHESARHKKLKPTATT